MRLAPHVLLAVGLATASAARVARAQSAQGTSVEDPARMHFARGLALLQERRFNDARIEFEAARALRATPAVHYNLGLVLRGLGRDADAAASFRRCLDAMGAESNPERRREIEGYLAEAASRVAHVAVQLTPPRAALRIDGRPVVGDPRLIDLDPGAHTITAEAEGYQSGHRALELAPGATAVIELALAPNGPRPLPAVVRPTPAPVRATATQPSPWPWVAVGVGVLVAGAVTAGLVLASQPSGEHGSWGQIEALRASGRP